MSSPTETDTPPPEHELLAMAYADGELNPAERERFEARLLAEPELALALADYHKLALLARRLAPAEPIDAEWARLARDPLQRFLRRGGMGLFFSGLALCLAVWCLDLLSDHALELPRVGLLGAGGGVVLLLTAGVRQRRAELPYDPYVHIKR